MRGCSDRVYDVRGTLPQRLVRYDQIMRAGWSAPRVVNKARELRALFGGGDDLARAIMEAVQALPYVPDPPGEGDQVRAPCRVLDLGGDCEDLAMTVGALDLASGFGAGLVLLPQPWADDDHISVRGLIDGAWRWQEPTVRAYLGENPFDAARRLARARL